MVLNIQHCTWEVPLNAPWKWKEIIILFKVVVQAKNVQDIWLVHIKNELEYETLLTVEDPIFSGQLESTT